MPGNDSAEPEAVSTACRARASGRERDSIAVVSTSGVGPSDLVAGISDSGESCDVDETSGLLSGRNVSVEPGSGGSTRVAGSSWVASVFLMVNAALGAGLLNFPAAYNQCGGLVVAIVIQAVLMVFVFSSMIILIHCANVNQSATYQDVVLLMCGKPAQVICAVTIAVYCFGTCITFFIIIGDQWDKFLTFAYGADYCHFWYMNRKFTLVSTSIVLVLPMCFSRRIDFLKYVSYAGVLAVLYVAVLVTVKYFVGSINPGPIKTSPSNWTDVFVVVPVICFGYQCHLSVIPIYSCMKKRTLGEFIKTILIALGVCVFCYTGTASFGYLTFGSHVQQDILVSYDPTTDILIATIMVAGKMYTTYPILLFVGRSALDSALMYFRRVPTDVVARGERTRRIATTVIWFSTSLLIAVVVPNIGVVIALLGGLAAIFLFVFPGLCLLQMVLKGHVDRDLQAVRYFLYLSMAVTFIVLGVFIFGLVTTQAIWNDVVYGSPKPHSHQIVCDI